MRAIGIWPGAINILWNNGFFRVNISCRLRNLGVRPVCVAVLAAVLLLWPTLFQAETDPTIKRRPAEIQITGRADVDRLVALGLIIDNVTSDRVRAYLNPDEFARVERLGLPVRWLPNTEQTRLKQYLTRPRATREITGYPTFEELTAELQALAAAYPDLCHLESAGQSVEGRDLWWLKISDNVGNEEDEPEFHYIASMHGDEPVGMILCLKLARYLLEQYGIDPRITQLVNETEIWIMPLMNPDGYMAVPNPTRLNAHDKDLNRSFPDPANDDPNTTDGKEPEVQAVMNWFQAHTPTLAANLHGGALLVAYPWDGTYDPSPDDALYIDLAITYSQANAEMWNDPYPPYDQGIVQGAYWYYVHGGMMDWAYNWMGCLEVTIEVSKEYVPEESELPGYWEANRESLLAYMGQVHRGVRGLVTDASTGLPLAASIRVDDNPIAVFTDPDVGDYHRLLLPGAYTLTVTADGYQTRTVTGVVVTDGAAVAVNVTLTPEPDEGDGGGGGGGGGCFIRVLTTRPVFP